MIDRLKSFLLAARFLPVLSAGLLVMIPRDALADEGKPDPDTAAVSSDIAEPVSYYREIRPIFQANCQGCHQPAKAKGGYVMTEFQSLIAGGEGNEAAILPFEPDDSYLVRLITPINGEAEMPQKAEPLDGEDIALIRRWIEQGAVDDTPANAKRRFSMANPPRYTLPPLITSLDFSPNGELLAVAGFHEVLLHRADGSGLVGRLVGLSARVESVRFSPDGARLAVTGGLPARMGEVQVWNVPEQKLELSVPLTFDTVYGASWSPDGSLIALGCTDRSVRAIDSRTGEQVLYQGAHDDWVLDTVFSLNGDHVVSVGRDRTAKLTELATQRFIDNLTSITPGALKGGLAAIARHPSRDEILVGGADGVPQIYRVFRQTKRVIGDNANLVRQFPPMAGRIFGVDFSPDGNRIATVSSLDGKGAAHIYSSASDAELSDELREIFKKTVSSRSAEERKKVEEYTTAEARLIGSIELDSGVYAVRFDPSGRRVAVAGGDGIVRLLDGETAGLVKAFIPVPLESETARTNRFITLSVEPSEIRFDRKIDYAQLLITGWTAEGQSEDLTRTVQYQYPDDLVAVGANGMVRPVKDGEGTLAVEVDGKSVRVPVSVSGAESPLHPDYIVDVMPAVSKMGCNAGTCHGSKDGRNGFKLSLRGYDPIYDVRAFTDDLSGRRINSASPDDSLMLLKSTGAVPHEGGQRTKPGDPYYELLRSWIADGAELDLSSPRVERIHLTPVKPVLQQIGTQQQMRVIAIYTDGRRRDVTAEAFVDSGNGEVAAVDEHGLVTTVRRGEAPLLARFEGAYAATTVTVMGDRAGFVWAEPEKNNRIDELVAAKWKRMKILPSELCTDTEFVRRIHLDLTGLPPTTVAVEEFLSDPRESRIKRDDLIDRLIGGDDYVDYWANKWADLLQVNGKFLGTEGAKLFKEWIRGEVAANTPYDKMARKILTATGSNRENPPAAYYKILRTPEETMENTTHLFLATRFNCNKCHDHPFERWTQDQYYEMSAFFAQVGLRGDPESKDRKIGGTAVEGAKPLFEIVFDKDDGEVRHERTGQVTPPDFPFQATATVEEGASRRERLAAWITSPDNPYFAMSYANRIWGYLTGVGIIEPIDDIRAGNPPSNPELLDWLTDEFVQSGFDVRHLVRLICQSRTYQLSISSNRWNEDDRVNFSHAIPKRLPAEVLYDAIYFATGAAPGFPGVPAGTRATQLPDVGVKLPDGFLGNLGRPARESACECERSNDLQLGSVMALVSGPTVDRAITDPENAITKLVETEQDNGKLVDQLFLRILNRHAQPIETEAALRTLSEMEEEHGTLVGRLADYEEKIEPIMAERARQRERDIEAAKTALGDYEIEIAPRELKRTREREEAIAAARNDIDAYEEKLPELVAAWESDSERATDWVPFKPRSLRATNGARLIRQKDLSILASGENGQGIYEITASTRLKNITGVRIEMLPDESLPKNGPGRNEDGNLVLTEFGVTWSSALNPARVNEVKLTEAKATFSQNGYPVKNAIDGGTGAGNGSGWAIHPEEGKIQIATFEFAEPVGDESGTLFRFELNQNYQSKTHSIGRFRISVTTSKKPVDFGLPENVAAALAVHVSERDDAQVQTIREYFKNQDPNWKTLESALAEAEKPVPDDPRLKELQAAVERVSKPLGEDPYLVELKRAVGLSTEQMKAKRLTAAQDLAWALINNPAFLFNH